MSLLRLTASDLGPDRLGSQRACFSAGEEITYEVFGYDSFGNAVDTTDITVDLLGPDFADATIGSEKITGITPGLYTVAASMGDLQDVELFKLRRDQPYL